MSLMHFFLLLLDDLMDQLLPSLMPLQQSTLDHQPFLTLLPLQSFLAIDSLPIQRPDCALRPKASLRLHHILIPKLMHVLGMLSEHRQSLPQRFFLCLNSIK